MIIPQNCEVTIYLDTETSDIQDNIQVAGTLTLNGLTEGKSHLNDGGGSITLLSGGCINFSFNDSTNYYYDGLKNNRDKFIEECINYDNGTFKINGVAYIPPSNSTE